jgi:hypothetical protein
MSWAEVSAWIDGYNRRLSDQWEIASHLAAWTVQPHIKKRIKPTDLYKPPRWKAEPVEVATPEHIQEVINRYGPVSIT